MGRAFELLTGFVTAPSTTLTALTMASGNSLTVRQTNGNSAAHLVQAWNQNETLGVLRIKSPKMHDDVQGLRLPAVAANPIPLLPDGFNERLFSQDTLDVDLSGIATSAHIESACMIVAYDDLPGAAARLMSPEAVMARIDHIMTVENTLALGVAGGYSGEEAINAEFDLFKANEDYALLGYEVTVECACVRWRGQETGNLGIGGPGNPSRPDITRNWFTRLSEWSGMPAIPIFNAANKAGILLDGAQDNDGADTVVRSIFGHLRTV